MGLDYSQRANTFAHHLVLDASELPPARPRLAVGGSRLHENFLGGPPGCPPGRRPPAGNAAPAICRNWQQLTGDAGWGGVLAQAAVDDRKGSATLIFRPGQNPLPLLAESLALLPAELRGA